MTFNPVRVKDYTALFGAVAESAATDHTSSSGLNGLLKAILRDFRARIPSLSNGRIPVVLANGSASSVTIATVAVTTTSAVLFAANANRIDWTVEHKGTVGEAYITEGVTATVALGKTVAVDGERGQEQIYGGVINVIGSVAFNLQSTEYSA